MHSTKLLFVITLLIGSITEFGANLIAPALSSISLHLHTSVDHAQWVIAIYLFGIAITQLIYGPLSEGIGRKTPLVTGLGIMLVGGMICLTAPNIVFLIVGRFFQGCGVGACSALWRSVLRDIFSGIKLVRYISYLFIFILIVVTSATGIGGFLDQFLGWRSLFWFINFYTIIALIVVYFGFEESSQHHHPERLRKEHIIYMFLQLISSRIFMGVALSTFLVFGAFIAWLTAGPILLVRVVGMNPFDFGWITFLVGVGAFIIAGWLNNKCVIRFGMTNMMRLGFMLLTLAGIFLIVTKMVFGIHAWNIFIPISLLYLALTFIYPNSIAIAFSPFGKSAGYAGTLYGSLKILGGACAGALIAHLPDKNQIPLATVILFSGILAWIIYELMVVPIEVKVRMK